jgi:hypothetical protein
VLQSSEYKVIFQENPDKISRILLYRVVEKRKADGKRSLGRPRRRWEDTIKIYLREDGVLWAGLISLRIGTNGGLL